MEHRIEELICAAQVRIEQVSRIFAMPNFGRSDSVPVVFF